MTSYTVASQLAGVIGNHEAPRLGVGPRGDTCLCVHLNACYASYAARQCHSLPLTSSVSSGTKIEFTTLEALE